MRALLTLPTCGPLFVEFFHRLSLGLAPPFMYDILGIAKLIPLRKDPNSDTEARPVGAGLDLSRGRGAARLLCGRSDDALTARWNRGIRPWVGTAGTGKAD